MDRRELFHEVLNDLEARLTLGEQPYNAVRPLASFDSSSSTTCR